MLTGCNSSSSDTPTEDISYDIEIETEYITHNDTKIKIKYNPKKGLCITPTPNKI